MIYSQIQITFNEDLPLEAFMQITANISSPITLVDISEIWKNLRVGPNQVTQGTPTSTPGERSAINFASAFNLDYNSSEAYTVSQLLNVVTIISTDSRFTFTSGTAVDDTETALDVDFAITASSGTEFQIDSVEFSQGDDECSEVEVSVTTTQLATKITSPFVLNGNTDNPFTFMWPRNQSFNLNCENVTEDTASQTGVVTPSFFDISNKEVIINNSPSGANLTIYLNSASDLEIEYSLDDATWQESNSFTGLVPDTYTVYVRDQYGCKQNFSVLISESDINSPYFLIPKSNSIRYANQIVWGDAANYKNDDNTLSFQAFAKDKRLAHKEIQLFQSADVITTQFRSNYTENIATILREQPAVPTPATSNILLHSEDLTNAIWLKNQTIIEGKKVKATSSNDNHSVSQIVNKGSSAGEHTFSVYLKPSEYNTITLGIYEDGGLGQVSIGFNVQSQSFFGGFGFDGYSFIDSDFSFEEDGYLRLSLKATLNATENVNLKLDIQNESGDLFYAGNGFKGIFVDKFQFKSGEATPYIQTIDTPQSSAYSDGYFHPSVIKKTNNIGLKEKRDAKIFSYDTGKTGIYFITGNIYNYDTDAVTGTHNLNGTLPDWAVEGNYIKIGASFYLIEAIVYDDSRNSDVIVFSNPYSGTANANQIVGCIYNLKNYEIYEFEIDMVNYLDERIQVRINANDPNFQDLVNISEFIEVVVRHEQTVDIHYWNENNTDMFYATGIKNRIRIPIFDVIASDDEESENHKTDTNSVLLSAEFYEGDEFEFEPQTKEMHRKTKLALSHKFVFIDGVQYVKNGNFESEKLEDSNLYSLKVKMLKAGEPFINNSNNGFEFDGSGEEIPGLIETESGFVKY